MSMQCAKNGNVRIAAGDHRRFEARFEGVAFAPHRHDTFTFAITTNGVQSFDYRGETRHSRPGGIVVLHPDEVHDGRAGTDEAFAYRAVTVEPAELQIALGGRPLPFITGGQSNHPDLIGAVAAMLHDFERPMDDLEWHSAMCDLADALLDAAGDPAVPTIADARGAERAREVLDAMPDSTIDMNRLEEETGVNRWQLARDFRALYGTSPYRYWQMRRLDRARICLSGGQPLAATAHACGFADQAHFNRQFKATYGITPKAWQKLVPQAPFRTIVQ